MSTMMTTPPPAAAAAAVTGRRRRQPAFFSSTRTLISDKDLSTRRGRATYWVVLGLVSLASIIAFIFPLYWMFTSALKHPVEYAASPPTFFPETFQPENYSNAWVKLDIAHFFFNTAYYAIGGWLLALTFDVCAAYALSKLRPIFGKVILFGILASLMLPATALLIPAYLTVVDVPLLHLNLLNSPWALWLPAIANAFNIYVLKRFFDQIPTELLDQASIDGAGKLRILWSVVLPLSRPVLGVISIFVVVSMWKDFLWPLLVLQDPQSQTLSVALSRLSANAFVAPTELMAGLAIASVPMIITFLVFQRQILSGLSAGGLKG